MFFNQFKSRNQKNQSWDQISLSEWQQIGYPWRPNKRELNFYEQIINQAHKDSNFHFKIAVLGATPELRNLLANQNISVDIVDFSSEMYQKMSKLVTSTENEKYYQSNWSNFLKKNKKNYNLLVADLVLRLRSQKETAELINLVEKSLTESGVFLTRFHSVSSIPNRCQFQDKNLPINNLEWKNFINQNNEQEKIDSLFFLLSEFFVNKNNEIDLKLMASNLKELKNNCQSSQKAHLLDLLTNKWACSSLDFFIKTKEDINILFRNFSVSNKIEINLNNSHSITTCAWKKEKL